MQSRVYWFSVAAICLSILIWFTSMFVVEASVSLDFGFFVVFRTITGSNSYWLSVILLCTLILGKDVYLCALDRFSNYKDYQIIQEIQKLEGDNGGAESMPMAGVGVRTNRGNFGIQDAGDQSIV